MWRSVKNNQDYKRYNQAWENDKDWAYQFNRALIELKFEAQDVEDSTVKERLVASYKYVDTEIERALISYQLALFYMVIGEREKARECFLEASDLHPGEYRIQDWNDYYGSFINTENFDLWREVYTKSHGDDLAHDITQLLEAIEKEELIQRPSNNTLHSTSYRCAARVE